MKPVRQILAAIVMTTTMACAASPQPAPPVLTQLPVTTAALPAGPCGDSQSGRYVGELFSAGAPRTVGFAPGLDADVYTPTDDPAACRAAIVWVHGGGFTEGGRDGLAEREWGRTLAARGYLVVMIDYRLGQGQPFSVLDANDEQRTVIAAAVADVQSAVQWIRGSAAQWSVDADRVALGGTSAGAMAALGAALTGAPVCAAVSVAGAIDPTWSSAYAPMALFVHGDADAVVPYKAAQSAAQLINEAAADPDRARVLTVPGAGHEITGIPAPDVELAVAGWLRTTVAARCGRWSGRLSRRSRFGV